jgi:hypothetical protein
MNKKELPLSPCLECGGPRALFRVSEHSMWMMMSQDIHVSISKQAQLSACTCLTCGATTLRPAPHRMEEIHQCTETEKPFLLDS